MSPWQSKGGPTVPDAECQADGARIRNGRQSSKGRSTAGIHSARGQQTTLNDHRVLHVPA
jgi:hypothetical protein